MARFDGQLHGGLPLMVTAGYRDRSIRRLIRESTVLELGMLDLEEIATALQDQDSWDHSWLIDPRSGQIGFWTEDGGIDGRTPVELEELELIAIEPLPSWVWYRDMADFAEGVSDQRAGRSLARAIEGKGAFRRFKDRLYQNHPDLVPAWQAFQSARAKRRAVQWLIDNSLVDQQAAEAVLATHSDPDLP